MRRRGTSAKFLMNSTAIRKSELLQPEFDVIVVGAGPAGAACALTLARKGANVLILEKAKIPGERNMSGGVLYGGLLPNYGLADLVPGFESAAPLQRRIISHEVFILSQPDWDKMSFRYYRLHRGSLPSRVGLIYFGFETGHDYSVLRRSFDSWFVNKAVEAGATLSTETTVLDLLKEKERVVGVETTSEGLRSKLVVDCSGVTSTLVESAGLRRGLVPRQLYHGIKRVYRLDESRIEQRFKARPGEGRALLYFGEFMLGISGGAFIYTNRDTLSVGLIVSMDSLIRATTEHYQRVGKFADVLDEFERHPMIAELVQGGELVEYSAHNIPKSPKCILKRPYGDGILVAGDALGSFVKLGAMTDGIRGAITTGMMAAETFLEANNSGSFTSKNLSRYRDRLSPIYEDVNRSGRDSFISESSFVYRTLPRLIFGTGFLSKTVTIKVQKEATKKGVPEGTSLLTYDVDRGFSQIKFNAELASKSITKPWIPTCPVNCYTLVTSKGVFSSFKDLYEHNLKVLSGETGSGGKFRRKALAQTIGDVAEGEVRFDHVACVGCGTCGVIGPNAMVQFTHEREGHGVRYRYG
jgi:electron transfer flavoprotein-quinone oxidoreductase